MLKKLLSLLLVSTLLSTLGIPVLAEKAEANSENPTILTDNEILTSDDTTFKSHFINLGGDPWVTYHDGWYYYMVTGNGFYVAKSRDLERVNSNPVSVFNMSDLIDGENLSIVKELWAPELHFIDGFWYIYFTAYDGEEKADTSTGVTGTPKNHRMYVLKSKTDDAQGEYEFMGQIKEVESDYINDKNYTNNSTHNPKPGHWAIDQTVFKWNNKLYTAWSGWASYENVDQRIYIAEMSDPCTISSSRVELSRPEYAYETYSVIPAVNEGPQALVSPDGKTLNIAFSVNRFDDPTYALGLLTLKKDGNPLNADDWTKTDEPVFETNVEKSTYSVGHCSFVQSPDNSETYVIYHARRGEDTDTNPREIRTQQIKWYNDGTPCFEDAIGATDPVSIPSGTAKIDRTELEAEDAVLEGGAFIVTSETNGIVTYADDYYSGGKRISLANSGRTATFTYNAEKAGKYTLSLLASGNSNTNSGLAVTVNGTEYTIKVQGGSGNVNIFVYYDLTNIELQKGENTIVVGHTPTYKNGAYLDRLDITNEQDETTARAKQDEINKTSNKAPVILTKPAEKTSFTEYNKEYTFNSFGDFDKYWFSTEPFVDDPVFEDVITTCRAGGNKRLLVTGKEFQNISDFKSSVEIIPTAKHIRSDGIEIVDETSVHSGILFRVGEMKDYTTNVCSFDGYRCFLTVSSGALKMQLHRYYFASETATTSTNKLLATSEGSLTLVPGDTYIIEISCIGNRVNAIAYNKNNPNEKIEIKNQSIETSVAKTLDSGRIGLFTNCVSRVAFKNMKVTSLDKNETFTQNYSELEDFEIKNSAAKNVATKTEDGIVTSAGALKMQALDSTVTYEEKTFGDFYNIKNYDIYGNKYHTTNYAVSTYGNTFDTTNNLITTADAQSKLKLDGTEGMTDFETEFTITKLGSGKTLYGGIAFRIQDSDFRTATFGTEGYMLFVSSTSSSKDVSIKLRKYTTSATYEEKTLTATNLLSVATNGVVVKITVSGQNLNFTVSDAKDSANTYSNSFSLVPADTAKGRYYSNGSFAFVTNGHHTIENITLNASIPANYTVNEKEIYNLNNREGYTIYGNTTGDDVVDYGATFTNGRISTTGQTKLMINNHSNVEDFKATFDLKKTNGNSLYAGIAFRIQGSFFEKAPYGTPGYMLYANSAADSMDVTLVLRNYSTASGYSTSQVKFEGFLAAPGNKNIRMDVEVVGNTLRATIYDLTDLTRTSTATFALKSTADKSGNFKAGALAFVSNGTHDFSNVSISEYVYEAPYTQVENFEASVDFELPSAQTIQAGIMFYVQDSIFKSAGLTAFSLNAIRTSNSADKTMSLQLMRYGTKADGTTNVNLGAVSNATNAVSNILQTANGAGENIRVKIKVIRGTLYYSLTNLDTGVSSNTYSIALNTSSTSSSVSYTTEYTSGGIGIFTNLAKVTVSNFNVTNLSDCTVTFSDVQGGVQTGDGVYSYGETVTVTATPDYGYYFGGWYSESTLLSTDETYSFTLTDNVVLSPEYIPFPIKITGLDNSNVSAVINIDSTENVTEIGLEVTHKTENGQVSQTLSTNYVNALSKGKKPYIATASKVYYCDLNSDGVADVLDLTVLRKGLISGNELSGAADLNSDEKINLKDLVKFKKIAADVELEFTDLNEGYNYPFAFGHLLEAEGKQYFEIKPYLITNDKKSYGVTKYLSFDGKTLTANSTSANHTAFGKVRIACVGDSITQGVGATGWASGDYSYAYPQQLGNILGDNCLVGNFGRGSSYVYYYDGRNAALWYPNTTQYTQSNNFDADIVIIKLGTNDARVMKDETTSVAWEKQFTELVNHYKNLDSKPTVYIMSSITMANYDEALETNLVKYILPKQKAVAEELDCIFLDAYTDLFDIFKSGEGFASDGLHPNNTGYAAMAEYVKENISIDIFF